MTTRGCRFRVLFLILLFLPLVLFVVIMGCSVKVIGYGDVGLRYNSVQSRIMDGYKIYPSGHHFVGVTSSFILFPAKSKILSVEDIHIINRASSYEIGVSSIFKLKNEAIKDVYDMYGSYENFETTLVRVMNHTFATKASDLDYEMYIEDQDTVQTTLNSYLHEAWEPMGVEITSFFLDYVKYNTEIENRMISNQVVKLNETLQETNGEYILLETKLYSMERCSENTIAGINVDASARVQEAEANAYVDESGERGSSYHCIINSLTADKVVIDKNDGTSITKEEVPGINLQETDMLKLMRNKCIMSSKAMDDKTAVIRYNAVDL